MKIMKGGKEIASDAIQASYLLAEEKRDADYGIAEAGRGTQYQAAEAARDLISDEDHNRAENDHTQALANNATVAGFNTRLVAEETATANNKISAVKGKTFADVDARFEDVEFDTTLMATNKITNGDFSNGITGWASYYNTSNLSASGNSLSVTSNGISSSYSAVQTTSVPVVDREKIYVRIQVSVANATGLTSLGLRVRGSTWHTPYDEACILTSISSGQTTNMSGVVTFTPLFSGNASLVVTTSYVDTATATNKTTVLKNAMLLNLTQTFGKGNEPTVEQMDGIMAKFPDSWFNGTANLFRANATLNKLLAVDARTEFEAKNIVSNGDFSNGTTSWQSTYGTLSAASNVLSVTGDGTNNSNRILGITNTSAVIGSKVYVRGSAQSTDASCNSITMTLRSASGGSVLGSAFSLVPVQNVWNTSSNIITVPSGQTLKTYEPYFTFNYADAASALGKVGNVKNVLIIDLTATFGAGKEPTLAEMDRLMARFTNSWFDGVKPIQTIETLYQEKANKVQEAWITPTLVNAWTIYTAIATRVSYRKNELGKVELRGFVGSGTAGTVAFTLPVGYRPIQTVVIPTVNGGRVTVYANGNVEITAFTTYCSLDAVSFNLD